MKKLRFNGKFNYYNGLSFYFSRQNHVISFLVDTIGDRKKRIRVTMQPDINHERPHVHIGKHGASIAIDTGELLAGDCDAKTLASIQDWISRHKTDLQELWEVAKGSGRYEQVVERIREGMSFKDFGFRGEEPATMTKIRGVKIWHNDELYFDNDFNGEKVVCQGDMFVGLPSDFTEGSITFEVVNGELNVKRA